jgi:hypothetical protein
MNSPAWAKLEPIRVRIMQEAYDCADRDEPEAYNSIKVMCGEVLALIEELIEAEREACALTVEQAGIEGMGTLAAAAAIRARGEK